MRVKVVGTKELPYSGVELTFQQDGQTKVLSSWIPPVVAQARKWQAGEEVEIEEYTDKKNQKQRFKTPQQRKESSRYAPDPGRDAVQAAVSLAQTAWRVPDGQPEFRSGEAAKGAADSMLAFVEKAIPRILAVGGVPGGYGLPGAGQVPADRVQAEPAQSSVSPSVPRGDADTEEAVGTTQLASAASSQASGEERGKPQSSRPSGAEPSESERFGEGRTDDDGSAPTILSLCPKSPTGQHELVPAPNKAAADRGLVMCKHCGEAGQPERFEKEVAPSAS